MQLTYNSKTLSVSEWSKIMGIREPTIYFRIKRGWSPEKALTEPVMTNDTKVTKNDAEIWLNDLSFSSLPQVFKSALGNKASRVKKYGQFIRSNHRKVFDEWFNDEYIKQLSK